MVVENTAIIEIKAVEHISTVHEAQLISYLKLANKPIGLISNFHVAVMKNGIRRKRN